MFLGTEHGDFVLFFANFQRKPGLHTSSVYLCFNLLISVRSDRGEEALRNGFSLSFCKKKGVIRVRYGLNTVLKEKL